MVVSDEAVVDNVVGRVDVGDVEGVLVVGRPGQTQGEALGEH